MNFSCYCPFPPRKSLNKTRKYNICSPFLKMKKVEIISQTEKCIHKSVRPKHIRLLNKNKFHSLLLQKNYYHFLSTVIYLMRGQHCPSCFLYCSSIPPHFLRCLFALTCFGTGTISSSGFGKLPVLCDHEIMEISSSSHSNSFF